MKKTELIIATIAIISLGLKLIFIPGSGVLTVLSLSTLSIIYCYLGFALFNDIELNKITKKETYKDISTKRIIGAVGAGVSLSMATIGIMFKFQSWPGASANLIFGIVGLSVVCIVGATKYSKSKSDYYVAIFKRASVFGGLALVLMIIPQTTWVAIKYRDQPAFIEAYNKAAADPDNKELWDKVEIEREKMRMDRAK